MPACWHRLIAPLSITRGARSIGTNKRWSALVEAAKWHGLQVEPDEPVRLQAVQKIQKAIHKRVPMNLSATGFQLVPGYFVDQNEVPVKLLGTVNL